MCEWNNTVNILVPIPDKLSHTGQPRWDYKPIDKCIADIVEALNLGGIYTESCCCGHSKEPGNILLQDGRKLIICF